MTPEELQEVVAAVIAALKTNGKTIDQLTAVTSLADTDNLEISNGKKMSFGKLKELVAAAVTVSAEEIKGWKLIESTDDLPEDPTQVQQEKAYVIANTSTMYVYVGYGGDILDGKYRSIQLKGDKGDSGVHLGDVVLVNNLTEGGEGSALTAEMGKVLNEKLPIETASEGDLEIADKNDFVLTRFSGGEIYTKKFNSANTPILGDASSAIDLAFADENGNIVLYIRNGHIITKNFDSSDINVENPLLAKFAGKKIGIIGDSISTYSGYLPSDVSGYDGSTYDTYYPHGEVNDVTFTWWYKMAQILGLDPQEDISNCAWSGSRVTGDSTSTLDASAGCSTRRINDLTERGFTPDIILVFISCNDWANEVALGTWVVTDAVPTEGTISTMRAAYALMLNKIHITYPNARVFCCTILDDYKRDNDAAEGQGVSNAYPPENGNGVTIFQWNAAIKEIAEAFACDVIDMHNCGITYSNIASYYAVDEGLHPNKAGMNLMARKVASELIAKY